METQGEMKIQCPKCGNELRIISGVYGRYQLVQCDHCRQLNSQRLYRIKKPLSFQDAAFEMMQKITRDYMVLGGEE